MSRDGADIQLPATNFFFFSLWQNRLLNERFRGRSPVGAAVVHFMVNFKDCLSWADGTA